MLQPIVENAVRHGLGQSEEAVTIAVTATRRNGSLALIVCDDGPYVVAETEWKVLRERCRSVAWASDDQKRYPIVTYDEAMRELAAVPGLHVFVEIKDPDQSRAQDEEFLESITKYGMLDRTVVTSYQPDALTRIDDLASGQGLFIRRMLNASADADAGLTDPAVLRRDGLWAVAVPSERVTESYFTAVKDQGLVAIAQDQASPREGEEDNDRIKIWSAMKAAGATTVVTDEPQAYQRWSG